MYSPEWMIFLFDHEMMPNFKKIIFPIFSSEGALYVIMTYDYPAQRPLFEHTPVLNNNFEYQCHDVFVDYDLYDD